MVVDKNTKPLAATSGVRHPVQEGLCAKRAEMPPPRTDLETQQLVQQLQIHQIELELQNDELRHSREDLELSRNTYAELYDFAPIGYFTFDARGVIQNTNFAGVQLLGIEKGLLKNKQFTDFITDEDEVKIFSYHLATALQQKVTLKCEIRVTNNDGTILYCQLQSVAVALGKKNGYILTSIIDNTIRRLLEKKLKKEHEYLEITVNERTIDLTRANQQLTQEIEERIKADESLKSAYAEIKRLKDRLQAENIYLQHEIAGQHNFGEIVGQSHALRQVFSQVEQVAPMNATILLLGETGTGKGVLARAIHSRSSRKDQPLITVNCTTLPATLVESELFGREKGAFTGSATRQIGRFELADGGTIFLDEIGELPLDLQCKLLRVIQDGEFERLGSPRTLKTDVRIIAATNRNLEDAIQQGRFREDLFYRLNVFPITLPPLRQRKEDLPLLIHHFIAKFNKKIGRKIESVSPETVNSLQEYHWPGNVRELESIIERAVIVSQGSTLQVLERFEPSRKSEEPSGQEVKVLIDLEHDHILKVLRKTGWRIEGKNGAAILLGLNASTLRARMRKYGIIRQ